MLILNKIFNKQKLFIINAHIEKENGFFKERVYFEFYDDYKRTKSIKMVLNTLDLRALYYAIREVLKKGSTEYKKVTGGNSGDKKILTIAPNYLNAHFNSFKIGIKFETYEMIALGDFFKFLADEVDRELIKAFKGEK